jgi:DNA polymerase III epsilon subunit-like protein
MTTVYSTLPHVRGNVLAAVDVETTGSRAGFHEIIQIAVVPLNSDLRPLPGVRPFNRYIAPLHPDREEKQATKVHGLDVNELFRTAPSPGRVADLLVEWFESLDLPVDKRLIPLAQNWSFERGFLDSWMGQSLVSNIFHFLARDSMSSALFLNDEYVFRGEIPPFQKVSLTALCQTLGVVNDHPHDALHDCLAEAEVYRRLVTMRQF